MPCWLPLALPEERAMNPEFKLNLPCKYLRNKEMYYQPMGAEDDEFSSGAYWCLKTQEPFGPDRGPTGRAECCADRTCFTVS